MTCCKSAPFQPRNDVSYRLSEQIDILRQISEAPAAARVAHRQDVDTIEPDEPTVGAEIPAIILPSVDLPEPE